MDHILNFTNGFSGMILYIIDILIIGYLAFERYLRHRRANILLREAENRRQRVVRQFQAVQTVPPTLVPE